MSRYRGNPEAVRALVQESQVHRDVYIDQEIFDLEMEHLFANTWIYVGHDSQVPNPGDYYTTTIGAQPIIMARHTDGVVHVMYNRCPHKGTKIAIDGCGENTASPANGHSPVKTTATRISSGRRRIPAECRTIREQARSKGNLRKSPRGKPAEHTPAGPRPEVRRAIRTGQIKPIW